MQALLDEVLSLRRKMTDCRYRGFVASTKMRVQTRPLLYYGTSIGVLYTATCVLCKIYVK